MKLFYALLALLASAPTFAALPAGVPTVTVAAPGSTTGATVISPSMLSGSGVNGIFSLFSGNNSTATAGNFYPFYKNGVAYQVTGGKTAYCFNITASSGAASSFFQLLSATASFTWNQSTALTGGVYQCGAAATYCAVANSTVAVPAPYPGVYSFGASTYVGMQAGNSQYYQIHMDCYEQ
jgi:hypothetical protein